MMTPYSHVHFAVATILAGVGIWFLTGGRRIPGRWLLIWYLVIGWVLSAVYYLPMLWMGDKFYLADGYRTFQEIWYPISMVLDLGHLFLITGAIYLLRKPADPAVVSRAAGSEGDFLSLDDGGLEAPPPTRHGCLTTYLVFGIIGNLGVIALIFANARALERAMDHLAPGVIPFSIFLTLLDIVCIIGVFKWQRWGFWGVCLLSAIGLILDVAIGAGAIAVLGSIVRPFMLYGVLRIGGSANAWDRLK
ncbi:MAG TPA: hypothetical protein VHI13_21705 [Candidatus Kapabacteria bacterium]|nr:hypothetical protein [Candidatus Kapabacteria bacterium]